ncbi:MAG: efflux RND transporter periplasmic adaptor subunit [Myxococcota bacterium]
MESDEAWLPQGAIAGRPWGQQWLWGGMALAVCVLGGCQGGEAKDGPAQAVEPEKRVTRIQTATIASVEFTDYTLLTGETEAEETVTVSAENPGRVVAVNFKEGEPVKKGQWLARLDVRSDATRSGQLRIALQQAERDLERTEELFEKGLATPADVEQAKLQVDNSRFELRQTRVGVSKSTASTPIAGVVDQEHIERGEYAAPGAPIATIVNYDTVLVRAGLPESKLPYAQKGREVVVRITALKREVRGRIRRVGIQANTKSRTFPIQVEIDNADHAIRPGMRADVVLPTTHYDAGVLVPRMALLESPEGSALFVHKGGKVERRRAKLGEGKGAYVLVLDGLKANEELVVTGQQFLTHGESVEVTRNTPCCAKEFAEQEAVLAERDGLKAPLQRKGEEGP